MAAPVYLRGSSGIWTIDGATFKPTPVSQIDKANSCRCMIFTEDGSLFAWCNAESMYLMDTKSKAVLHDLQIPKVVDMKFSPLGNILVAWSTYTVDKETKTGKPNLTVVDVKTGSVIKTFIQKKPTNWAPAWSIDEELCIRQVNNELHFFEKNNFDVVASKLQVQKVSAFSLALSPSPYTFAANFPGSKGQPSFVRVYNYPQHGGVLASKSFFKGDRVDFYWNKRGSSVLILTSTESSDSSYYGDQGLHFLSTKGDSCFVPMQKEGPVYHVEWAPGDKEFIVMHGYMPCKSTIYNLKCEPTFDFGTGAWNTCCFNPQGNILLLAGFGNLPGNLEFWDYGQKKIITKTQAPDSTNFSWCPDGQHLLTSTTSPRLRVGNGYRVWHYSGTLMMHHPIPNGELWQAEFQTVPEDKMPVFTISAKSVASTTEQPKAKSQAYVPPHVRAAGRTTKPIQEFEAPSNVRSAAAPSIVRSAAKERRPVGMAAAAPTSNPGQDVGKRKKNLKKKIKDIEKLKELQASGTKLDHNQEEKVKQLDSAMQDLKSLELS